ncbi:hypothetical protein AWENTII_004558 [Aspergillus wentii]|nr:hypothetical protein MW887_010973 [Aspergillus wentii]
MIPPCDPAILESNPQFKRLYQNLTTSLLNPDGSTRANDAQPARQEVLEDLKSCRMRHAKKQIKKQTLRQLAFDPDSGLPDEYRDPVAVITLYLESPRSQIDLDQDDRNGEADNTLSLLAPDIDTFYSSIPALIRPFSNRLSSAISDLRVITNAGGPVQSAPEASAVSTETSRPRGRGRQFSSKATTQPLVSTKLNERLQALREIQLSQLPAARKEIAAMAAGVLAARAQVMERTVMILERAKHGAMARATRAKAENLATVAEGVEGKLSVMKYDISNAIYTPDTVAALNRYRHHLRDVRERLEERQTLAMEELATYEVDDADDHDPMTDIVRRYMALIKEIENVNADIQRLNG